MNERAQTRENTATLRSCQPARSKTRAGHGRGAVHQVRLRTFEVSQWELREGRIHISLSASVSRYAL
jgi:hypothetical protein